MAAHAKFSPSAMYRREPCPGSWSAEQGKISVSSPAAREGSISHTFGEHCILNDKNPLEYVGQELGSGVFHTPVVITEERALAVKVYVDYVREQSIGAAHARPEIRLQMPGHIDFWGTSDMVIAHDFGTLEVIDYKDGTGYSVYAEDNRQIAAYMLGALRFARDNDITPLRLKGTIIQPRVHDWDGPRTWEITDIANFEQKWTEHFTNVILDCLSKDPKRCAGDHCTFCLAKLECPELKDKLLIAAIDEFKDAPVEEIKKEQIKEIVVDASTEELLRIHSHASIVKKFLKEAAAHLKARAEAGENLPGYKLVNSVGNRAWNIPEEELVKKFRNKKLKQDDYYNKEIKSPAQIEKILEDERFFDRYVHRPSKGLALVPAKDKRDAVEIKSAVEEFTDG